MIATNLHTFTPAPRPKRAAPLRLTFPAQAAQVGMTRRALARFLREAGWTEDNADAVLLAVGEACNNAVEHCRPEQAVSLCCTLSRQGLSVEVRNPGADFAPNLSALCVLPEDEWATHGRGYALMSMLMDTVQVAAEEGQTVVRLFKAPAA